VHSRTPGAQRCIRAPPGSTRADGERRPGPWEGTALARLAVAAVGAALRGEPPDGRPPATPRLRALGASFVTLQSRGALRGCIGTLEAVRPLYLDVLRNARRATTDPGCRR